MSKRNRYKFRDRPAVNTSSDSSSASNSVVSATPASNGRVSASASAMNQHVAEYRIISKDLIRLVVLNGVMLAAVLVVYFTNRTSGYLERMFQSLF